MDVISAVLPDYQAELLTLIRGTLSPKALRNQVTNFRAKKSELIRQSLPAR